MSAVEVEVQFADDTPGRGIPDPPPGGESHEGPKAERQTRSKRESVEVEIEREVTKRQLIQSVSTILVVLLYMVFTLLRDRDGGVVVVDPDEGSDDWDEG